MPRTKVCGECCADLTRGDHTPFCNQQPGNGYICRHCGRRHCSDDTELWCGIAASVKAEGVKKGSPVDEE